jgi:F-type H+-transporting ATPase subunit a
MESHIVLAPEILGHLGPVPITNTLLVSWIVMFFLVIISIFATTRMKAIPSGLQNFFEVIIEQGYKTCEDLAGKRAKVFFPIVFTFFLFIITANWFGLFPGFATVGFWEEHEVASHETLPENHNQVTTDDHAESITDYSAASMTETQPIPHTNEEIKPEKEKVFVPLLRSINSDLNMTLALALISAVVTHFFAIKYLGLFDYLKRWVSLNPVLLFVGILEIISEFTKVVSLSFRLFGNIFAGEVVLATVAGIFAFLVPLPFYFLEIIVGFVQAAVFMMLTLVFMVLLSEKHGQEHSS